MRQSLLFCLAILCTVANISAQKRTTLKALKVGDTVPDIVLSKMINYPGGKARLSDFKGKLLILDFWGSGCKGCIAAFPKMETFQEKFRAHLQILTVAREPRQALVKLKEHSPIVKKMKLAGVIEDTLLNRLFPHVAEPFMIWIDKDGVVRAMADGRQATDDNIQKAIDGKFAFMQVSAEYFNYEYSKSILQEGGGRQITGLEYYSLLTRIKGVSVNTSGFLIDEGNSNRPSIFRILSISMISLFGSAFEQQYHDRIILEVPHPEQYFTPADSNRRSEWLKDNLYCYEIKALKAKMPGILQKDIQCYFGLTASKEKRKLLCRIIHRTGPENKLVLGQKNEEGYLEVSRDHLFLRNQHFAEFVDSYHHTNYIRNKYLTKPLLDETGYSGTLKIDMEIDCAMNDLTELNKALSRYGLEVIEAEREIEVLVLRNTRPS